MMPQMTVFSKEPRAGAPASDREIATEHAPEMREMGNAFLRAGDAEEKLQRAVKRHEKPCRHRNRREKEHHHAAREVEAESEQQSKHTAGSADRRVCRHVARAR